MTTTDEHRLRQALRDPAAWVHDQAAAQAAYLLREHGLRHVAAAAATAGVAPLLVKGAALARTAYRDRPWCREMGDVDLLVDAADRARLLDALAGVGAVVHHHPERPLTSPALGEIACTLPLGAAALQVELHTSLDKIAARSIPYGDIARRSVPAGDLAPLRLPADEDQTLLVVVHATTSQRPHPSALVDLAALLRGGLTPLHLRERAAAWGLRTSMFVMLTTLQRLDPDLVAAVDVAAFEPSPWRRQALRVLREPTTPWLLRQAALRDDTGTWLAGLAQYAALRLAERAFPR